MLYLNEFDNYNLHWDLINYWDLVVVSIYSRYVDGYNLDLIFLFFF